MPQLPPSVTNALLRIRLGEAPLEDVLHQLVVIAAQALPGVDEVSTTLVRGDRAWTAAHSGQLALDADEMQYERGYGPCIEAGTTGTVLVVDDMREETRWPDYAAHVVQRGVLGSLSVPLPVQTEVVGALNCYCRTAGAVSTATIAMAEELAAHLAVAVANAVAYTDATRQAADMRAAMASRAVIDQAMGVLMAQNRCDAAAAFALLVRTSQARNVKLRDVAARIVAGVARPAGPGGGTAAG